MDLLQNKQNKKNQIAFAEICHIFAEICVHNEKIAEEFFDFSKDMDVSLLDDAEFEDINDHDQVSSRSRSYLFNEKEVHNEYTDRLILFLDAIGGNTMANSLEYNFRYSDSSDRKRIISRVTHALSRRYNEEQVQAKLAAIFAEIFNTYDFSFELWKFSEENYKALFIAAENYCYGNHPNAKIELYAFALARYEMIKETLSEPDTETEKYISSAIEFLFERYIKNKQQLNDKDFEFVLTTCFLVMDYDYRFKKFIINSIYQDEKIKANFLANTLKFIPNEYLEHKVDTLIELLDFKNSPKDTAYCIKFVVIEFGADLTDLQLFLKTVAKEYPEQYIEAMRSTECIRTSKFYHTSLFAANSYEDMYKILEEENPEVIKTYNIDFETELLDLAAKSEQSMAKRQCRNQVYQYLSGQCDISVLEPYFPLLHDNYIDSAKNSKIIESCMKCNDMFKRRFIALKCIQRQLIRTFRELLDEKNNSNNIISLEYIINSLIRENVPVQYRFETYSSFFEYYYDEPTKLKIFNAISKAMAENSEAFDDEYKQYLSSKAGFGDPAEIFRRKVYLNYLDLSNNENKNKDLILSMCSDTSKQVRLLAIEIISKHKEYENDVIEMLKSKKQASREVAVDIIAAWGVNNYKDILSETAEKEKSAKVADKIESLFNVAITISDDDNNEISPLVLAEKINSGNKSKKVAWLYETPSSIVHFNNGAVADTKYMQAVLICYADMTEFGPSATANLLTKELNQEELHKFTAEIFSKWVEAGAEAKKKWVLYFSAIHGGNAMIDVFLHYVKEWAEIARGAIAAEAIKALVLNGSSEALMSIDNIAHKFKHKQVKNAAIQALDSAAEALGITPDELGDRIVPDLGFNENMERIFDYGTRKFKVYLTPTLEVEVYDENNKKIKNMPAPSKKDDEETAKKSNAEFKQMKKQLKNVVSIQKLRLETALLTDRRWDREAWNNLFVKNPVMHSFAMGLIWAAYENNYELVQTFRYMEDGSFNTSDEDEYTLPENCTIGLVHPIDLDEDTLSTWKEQLSDYEITQPIEQLDRTVYKINDDEIGQVNLDRFKGRTINDMTLLGRMTKFGWSKGIIQNAGCFNSFNRKDIVKHIKNNDGTYQIIENSVEFEFSGMYVSGMNEEVKVESVRFYTCIKRSNDEINNKPMKLKLEKVKPCYFSEIINQIENILKGTE